MITTSARELRAGKRLGRAGFTLVEMMVVIIIVGSMVSVIAMNWQKIMPRTQLGASVRALSNTLASTRSEAITRNNEYRIIYDLDEQRYWVETPFLKEGGLALQRIPGEEDPEEENARILTSLTLMKNGVSLSSVTIDEEVYVDGQCYVRFSPQGSSSSHTILLHHASTQRNYTIEVLALSGQIRFHDGVFNRDEVDDGDFE